jgi:serine/threonine-protein kinase
MIGKILDGRYLVTEVLSKGGFGHTFLAQDTKRPGSPVCVVKQLKPAFSEADLLKVAHKLFEREAEILEALGKHPQIPRLLAYFEENSEFYLVQEYIDGHTLDRELIPNKPLSENQVIAIFIEVLEILEFVHSHSVIHRDIKPENIIRSRETNKLFLIDFGAVKQIINNQNRQATAIGTVIGTFPYITLEVCHGKPQFSSDIYALGMIGIKAITGAKLEPYMGGGFEMDSLGKILWRDRAVVSDEFAEILTKMVHQDYRQRYQTAAEAIAELRVLQPLQDTLPDARYSSQAGGHFNTVHQTGEYSSSPLGQNTRPTIISEIPSQSQQLSSSPSHAQQSPSASSGKKLAIGVGIAAIVVIPVAYFIINMLSESLPELATDNKFNEGILTASNVCKDIQAQGIFCQKYSLKGTKGQRVTIEMNSQDFDPMLVLLNSDGSQLEINDDISPENSNAKLDKIPLPNDGSYTVIARTTFAGEVGKYTISASAE